MGAAILAIGAGVNLAAKGVAVLVQAFKDVGDNATAAVFGILAFGTAIGIVTAALGIFAPAALPAIAVLGGIALAAYGRYSNCFDWHVRYSEFNWGNTDGWLGW